MAGRSMPYAQPVSDHQLRVLLVEDDPEDAYIVEQYFHEARATVAVTVAPTLARASELVADADCVLLDLGLPDAQGLDALRRLLAVAPGAAICVLTGQGDEGLGNAAVGEGAQDYLIKGEVTGAVLLRAVRYAVGRRRADENARRLHEVELIQQESARLERGLLPLPLLRTPDVLVETFYQPGRHSAQLGGDFYDVVQTSDDRVSLMVGDVCGHGVDEAALGVELRVAWRALLLAGVAPDEVLTAIEHVLVSERNGQDVFATLAMVTVDLPERRVEVRLAGHPPPLLVAGGEVSVVPARYGPVLGVFPHAERSATTLRLERDDASLLLYTDGLIEGRIGEGDRRLDVAGLRAFISGAHARSVPREQLCAWLVARAEHINGGPLADDVAMLLLTLRRPP
jgi:serine phosphatase RsbU (regulator of sigma subunit)